MSNRTAVPDRCKEIVLLTLKSVLEDLLNNDTGELSSGPEYSYNTIHDERIYKVAAAYGIKLEVTEGVKAALARNQS